MSHRKNERCIKACNDCADACDHCAIECLGEDDAEALSGCIATDIDCAVICRMAAGFMARGSLHMAEVCSLCAAICDDCAAECSLHGPAHCKECSDACRRCAEECRQMAASSG